MPNLSAVCRAEKREDLAQEIITRLRDTRSEKRLFHDFDKSIRREALTIRALIALHFSYGYEAHGDKISETELNGIETDKNYIRRQPDYFYFMRKIGEPRFTTITYEIKCNSTDRFLDDTVLIKCPAIWTMNKEFAKYPNGRVIVATQNQFATLSARLVKDFTIAPVEQWGNKKAYHIPVAALEWKPWLIPISDW